MHRIHVRDQDIIDGFLERERDNDRKEGEERDDEALLALEQALWDEMYPEQARLRKEPEGDEVEEYENGSNSPITEVLFCLLQSKLLKCPSKGGTDLRAGRVP